MCICVLVFSKSELYDMCWDLKDGLGDCLVAAAPYGGPIGTHTVLQESILYKHLISLAYYLFSFVHFLSISLSPSSSIPCTSFSFSPPPQLSSGNLSDVLLVLVLSWRFILHLDLPSPASL